MWWMAEPEAPIGIAAAMSGLVVLDIDRRNGGDETFGRLQRELGKLPNTPTSLTPGGGFHIFFRDEIGEYRGAAGEGVDVKSAGYVLAPPSRHPNGAPYRWDVAAHPSDTPLASLPDRWLAHITSRPKTVLPSSGIDAIDSWLGRAFEAAGWLGDVHPDGRRNVRCPWAHEHSDGRGDGSDSSTILFARAADRTLGGFRCSHAHCSTRTWRDVVDVLPSAAKWKADQAMTKERNQVAIRQLASMRGAV
jgi:hypothetical protein